MDFTREDIAQEIDMKFLDGGFMAPQHTQSDHTVSPVPHSFLIDLEVVLIKPLHRLQVDGLFGVVIAR